MLPQADTIGWRAYSELHIEPCSDGWCKSEPPILESGATTGSVYQRE
jgi:hypothetical protein